jgi:hypothetical protein
MNDAPHLIEPLRVQVVGHLDVLMVLPKQTACEWAMEWIIFLG